MKKIYLILLVLLAGITMNVLLSCRFGCVRGSGNQASETRKVSDFTSVDISGGYRIVLKQDSSLTLKITADDNLLKFIKTDVRGDRLRIYSHKNLCNKGEMTVYIGFRNLDEIKASGGVEVESDGKVTAQDLHFKLSGATKVTMDLTAANVTTRGSGATELNLKGQATSHDIDLSGSGKINALDFVVGTCNIRTS